MRIPYRKIQDDILHFPGEADEWFMGRKLYHGRYYPRWNWKSKKVRRKVQRLLNEEVSDGVLDYILDKEGFEDDFEPIMNENYDYQEWLDFM